MVINPNGKSNVKFTMARYSAFITGHSEFTVAHLYCLLLLTTMSFNLNNSMVFEVQRDIVKFWISEISVGFLLTTRVIILVLSKLTFVQW